MNAITPIQTTELVAFEGTPMDRNPAAVFLAGKRPNSRRVYRADLDYIGRLLGAPDALACNWGALEFQYTQAIRSRLQEVVSDRTGKPLAPATVNRILCALRGVLKTAWRLGYMDSEQFMRAADVESVIGETLPAGRELETGEITALMQACENDPGIAGVRDAAIIALGYGCGLRRAEIVDLDLENYNQETGLLKVTGKRNKERTAYLVNGAKQAMADWLQVRGDEPGPLFLAINKAGKIRTGRLTTQAIYNMLAKRAGGASVRSFSPHDLRRTFVSDLLEAGADISVVAKMAGHASVQTTSRYDRRPEGAKQKAAELLHVPYRGRMI